jgi:hypothetical protein
MKGKNMKTFFDQAKKEEGSVLVVALLILVLLTLIGISATRTGEIEVQISGNEKTYKTAFYAAEAGIEVGRAVLNDLKVADAGSWDNLLSGTQFTWEGQNVTSVASGDPAGDMIIDAVIDAGGGRNVGEASYNLQVRDNDDLDGNDDVDTDNIIILTSTGSYGNGQAQIQAIVRYTGGGDQYAQEHYDTDSSGRASREGTAVAQNQRW